MPPSPHTPSFFARSDIYVCDNRGPGGSWSDYVCMPPTTFEVGTTTLTISDASTLYARGATVNFAWAASGAVPPLIISLWDTTTLIASLEAPDPADGTGALTLGTSVAAGWYTLWCCDDIGVCAPPLTITYISPPSPPAAGALPSPSPDTPVLELTILFAATQVSAFATDAVQAAVLLAAGQVLGVPYAALTFVGATDASVPLPRARVLLGAGARVQLGLSTDAAEASLVLVANYAGGSGTAWLARAVTSAFNANVPTFAALLIAVAPAGTFPSQAPLISSLTLDAAKCVAPPPPPSRARARLFLFTPYLLTPLCPTPLPPPHTPPAPASPVGSVVLSPSPRPRASSAPPSIVGLAVGVAVGAVVLIIAVVILVRCCCMKKDDANVVVVVQQGAQGGTIAKSPNMVVRVTPAGSTV